MTGYSGNKHNQKMNLICGRHVSTIIADTAYDTVSASLEPLHQNQFLLQVFIAGMLAKVEVQLHRRHFGGTLGGTRKTLERACRRGIIQRMDDNWYLSLSYGKITERVFKLRT